MPEQTIRQLQSQGYTVIVNRLGILTTGAGFGGRRTARPELQPHRHAERRSPTRTVYVDVK